MLVELHLPLKTACLLLLVTSAVPLVFLSGGCIHGKMSFREDVLVAVSSGKVQNSPEMRTRASQEEQPVTGEIFRRMGERKDVLSR